MDTVLIDVWGYRGFLRAGALAGPPASAGPTSGSAPSPAPTRTRTRSTGCTASSTSTRWSCWRSRTRSRSTGRGSWASTCRASCPDLRLRDDLQPVEITQPDGRLVHARRSRAGVAELVAAARLQPPRGPRPAHARRSTAGRSRTGISLAEMVVPYRDPSPDHYRRTAYDIGEWGLGFMTQSLELGCDCLGEIRYLDAVLHDTARRAVHDQERGLHPRGGRRRAVEARRPRRGRRGPALAPARDLRPRDRRQLRVPRLLAALPGRLDRVPRARDRDHGRRAPARGRARARTARWSTSAPTRRSTSTS